MQSHGKPGWYTCCGQRYYCQSIAEGMFLTEIIEPAVKGGNILYFKSQPGPFPYEYNYKSVPCTGTYTPDFYIEWDDGDKLYYEVKRGNIEQKSATKMKRFCLQYGTTKPLVLVWYGRLPTKGNRKKNLDKLKRGQNDSLLHHTWNIKR